MANVCSKCSTDNADGALACRHCGAALAPAAGWSRSLIPEDDNFDPLSAPTLVMQHTAPAPLPSLEELAPIPAAGSTGRRLVWGLAAFAVLLVAGVWLLRPAADAPVLATQPAAAPASALALATAASAVVPPAPAQAASASAFVPPPVGSASASLPAPSPVSGPAAVVAAVASSVPAPASAVERRKRIPEPVIRRPLPASAPTAPASTPAPALSPPAAPAAEPARPKSVAELCAGSNLLTRGFCEHRECRKAEHAGDPVCRRIKEAEEDRRLRQ